MQPIWIVTFGKSFRVFYTAHHAEQFARALYLNGTPYRLTQRIGSGPIVEQRS